MPESKETTPRPWRRGRCGGSVVAESECGTHPLSHDDREHYGGALVCESVYSANADLIIRAVNSYGEPVPMILTCIACGARHVDGVAQDGTDWSKKPHHTHSCQTCGVTWRPALVNTVGVQFLPGFKNDGKGAANG